MSASEHPSGISFEFFPPNTEAGREKLKTSPLPLQLRISEAFSELPTWEQAMILASLERLGSLLDGDDVAGSPPK